MMQAVSVCREKIEIEQIENGFLITYFIPDEENYNEEHQLYCMDTEDIAEFLYGFYNGEADTGDDVEPIVDGPQEVTPPFISIPISNEEETA